VALANLFFVGIGSFLLSFVWRYLIRRKEQGLNRRRSGVARVTLSRACSASGDSPSRPWCCRHRCTGLPLRLFHVPDQHHDHGPDLRHAGAGLNIVVGWPACWTWATWPFTRWVPIPTPCSTTISGWVSGWRCPSAALGARCSASSSGFPVLRLRGDYLAIVTLGFGEIIRLILENWNAFSFGPSGIANIPRPGLFGIDLNIEQQRPSTSIS
jgi:branched-chain amino acid transport system permease protein